MCCGSGTNTQPARVDSAATHAFAALSEFGGDGWGGEEMKRNVGLLGALLCLLCVVGWSAGAQRPATRPAWEYKVIYYTCPDEKALDELGTQGWELISAEAHT